MQKSQKLHETEWSVLVRADDIPQGGKKLTISPDDGEKRALAKRLDILALPELQAELFLERDTAHIVHVKGQFKACIKQECVITLDPVETDIIDEFEAWYADDSKAVSFKRAQHEAQSKKELLSIPMLDESEDPEPMINGAVDLGDLVTQYLSLAIPPYPTKEGMTYSVQIEDSAPKNNLKLNPFAALKDWRPKD